ncbi:ribosome silencing factor [Pelomonas sp. UHG3]|uniref:Ribosome silencing factor n=1 Tax=Roseateles hydrophilus TaxID=2975054 RepID=A0ACC6C626_9BURK|nr:ribosome silencing factor [Pelomonas sp. UHG3]MCY4743724.1 ribosome silencing factor [Pelomonas sp. UHG3]
MDIRKLQRAIVDGLEDVKAQNIVVFNTEHLSPLFERVIIASGTSNRQTKALASSVREAVKGGGMQVMRTEGEDNGEWIIVDCGAAVVHVMQPAIRDYYRLEEIWGGKPVKLKVASGETKLVKASEEVAPAAKTAAKKAPAKKAAAPAKKAAPAAKTVAKKAPAKKTPARVVDAKTPAAKTIKVGAAKPAAKKTVAKKAAVKTTVGVKKAAPAKTAAKAAVKTTAKAAPAKKVAAKKAPAKKG